jgi:8-oxo-dGTP pyrophosphatase MutT (NUDIX family)
MTRILEIKQKLLSADSSKFPGPVAHMEMTPYKKELTVKPESPRLSAVLILLYETEVDIEILLLKRSDYQGVHSAQVSFPGGKKDDSDPDLSFTAMRELEEETGIKNEKIELISSLSPMFIPPSNFMVHPFIAISEALPEIILDQRESQYYFGIKLNELLSDEFLSETDITTSYGKMKNVPYFKMNDEVIWGATAAILNELKWILKNRF